MPRQKGYFSSLKSILNNYQNDYLFKKTFKLSNRYILHRNLAKRKKYFFIPLLSSSFDFEAWLDLRELVDFLMTWRLISKSFSWFSGSSCKSDRIGATLVVFLGLLRFLGGLGLAKCCSVSVSATPKSSFRSLLLNCALFTENRKRQKFKIWKMMGVTVPLSYKMGEKKAYLLHYYPNDRILEMFILIWQKILLNNFKILMPFEKLW